MDIENLDNVLCALLEYEKFALDAFKHLTTLVTGVIVIVATFHSKVSEAKHLRWTIPIATCLLLVCLMYSLKLCMSTLQGHADITALRGHLGVRNGGVASLSGDIEKRTKRLARQDTVVKVGLAIASWTFFGGIISLGAFIVANIY